MKTTAILVAALSLALGSLQAQTVPLYINYQGKVADSTGTGLGTGTPINRKVVFRIYDAATAGNRLWTEEQTVILSNGEFSVLLGQGIPATGTAAGESRPAIDTIFTSSGANRFLGITVDNGDNTINASDTEMSPRQQITSTAYSFRARAADTIASGTDLQLNGSANYGLGYYGTGRLFNGVAVDGPVLYGQGGGVLGAVNGATQTPALRWNEFGQIGIGTTTLPGSGGTTKLTLQGDDATAPPLQLTIRGNTDTNKRLLVGFNTTNNYGSLQAYSAASTASTLTLNPIGGNVGIGNTNPTAKLDVTGTIAASGAITSGGAIAALGSAGHGFSSGDLDGGLFSPADGVVTLNTNGNERLRADATGNIGIGTNAPATKLHVNGNCTFGPTNGNNFGLFGNQIQQYNNGTPAAMFLNLNGGGVIIGNGDGNKGLLVVGSGYGVNFGANKYFDQINTTSSILSGSGGSFSTAIYAAGWIIDTLGFACVSDARIKVIESISDGAKDLDALCGIQVTNYHFKDQITMGAKSSKKVIAQQLEKVFPQAVNSTTDVVPDIYQRAHFKDGWVTLDTDLKTGERVRLVDKKEEKVFEVLETKPGAFRTELQSGDAEIFVYGREVKDFRTVDYDAVAMLNVSATQQIKKEKDAEIAALQNTLAAQAQRLAELEAKDKAREAKLAAIEELLQSSCKPAARTVSLKQAE